ncbi:Modification methylase FokI [Arcobacter porcinus]|uniref:DNA adenine methylase n=1 Tax=Arcobacter porcinus TaxID=1935204 RepID=UPI0008284AAD|nr:DNA adenine methylase [Arcobacter porcinus]OCL81609.1 Modification methylase FokI [Arcobacter porcinus]
MKNEIKITIDDLYLKYLDTNIQKNNLPSYSKAVEKLIHDSTDELKNIPFDKFSINNRRYMGSKAKLLEFISNSINEVIGSYSSFVDIFAGTGVVGNYFNDSNIKVISNDLLYSNYITNYAFLSNESFDYNKIDCYVNEFNNTKGKENYFSKHFGDKFFSKDTAKKIGTIRENIEKLYKNNTINFREKAILITSLIYASDKIANTCGHYDAYRENTELKDDIFLKHLDIFHNKNINNEIYNTDSNILFEQLDYNVDVVYADPPYNSRQYSSLYHLVENLARWEKPVVEGKASKMINRKELNSKYCSKTAIESFEELISNVKAKYFILSYSNMGIKGNDRSNARMIEDDIKRVMENKGKLIIKEMSHQPFSTGKSKIHDHKELLFICELNKI